MSPPGPGRRTVMSTAGRCGATRLKPSFVLAVTSRRPIQPLYFGDWMAADRVSFGGLGYIRLKARNLPNSSWQQHARIEQAKRIERRLDRSHDGNLGRAAGQLEPACLSPPDAML
jgi:hypothetical protein